MTRILLTTFVLLSITSGFCQDFTGQFKLVFSYISPEGNERRDTVTYCFNDQRTAMVIRGRHGEPDMRMVFDLESQTITALVEENNKKIGYQLPMDPIHWPGMLQSTSKFEPENKSVQFTGASKTIEGYTCKEALVESAEYKAVVWIADNLPLNMLRVLSYQSVGKQRSKKEIELFEQFGISGLPLEMELESKTGKSDLDMKIIALESNVDTELLSTDADEMYDARD